jgi:hypothetical protein
MQTEVANLIPREPRGATVARGARAWSEQRSRVVPPGFNSRLDSPHTLHGILARTIQQPGTAENQG